MKDELKVYLEDMSFGYGTENGVPVEMKGKILPPYYRRSAFLNDHPGARIIMDLKQENRNGVIVECKIYRAGETDPSATGIGFFSGHDGNAYAAAQTRAERLALTRLGYSYPEEAIESEPIDIGNTVNPMSQNVPLPVLDENGQIVFPEEPKTTSVVPAAAPAKKKKPSPASHAQLETTAETVIQPESVGQAAPQEIEKPEPVVFPDGKYKGMTIDEVMAKDASYIDALRKYLADDAKKELLRKKLPGIVAILENATI